MHIHNLSHLIATIGMLAADLADREAEKEALEVALTASMAREREQYARANLLSSDNLRQERELIEARQEIRQLHTMAQRTVYTSNTEPPSARTPRGQAWHRAQAEGGR